MVRGAAANFHLATDASRRESICYIPVDVYASYAASEAAETNGATASESVSLVSPYSCCREGTATAEEI